MDRPGFDYPAFRQATYRLYGHFFEPLLRQYQLTQMEADILLFLYCRPGRDTAASMVSLRRLSKSHVSAAVAQLLKRGYLRRARDPADRRLYHLKMTQSAADLARELEACRRGFRDAVLAGFSDAEKELLRAFLTRITDNARQGLT